MNYDEVRDILRNPLHREWTLQGFGMLRTYITKEIRLHVWDDRFATANVSVMHTHPWDFTSDVVVGEMWNFRFRECNDSFGPVTHNRQLLQCGAGGGVKEEPSLVRMLECSREIVSETCSYNESADETHISIPTRGCVTLVTRTFRFDTEHAYVYWPVGTQWVSAEPRKATDSEVHTICDHSIRKYFS